MNDTLASLVASPVAPKNAPETIADQASFALAVGQLRSTNTIRQRAQALLARARRGDSAWFTVHHAALPATAALVAGVTRARYPDLAIPFHSRWRHFEAGGVDRLAVLNQALPQASAAARACTHIDLALVSVLLDAGAGPQWRFTEAADATRPAQEFSRSEGLGVASFHAFMAGLFSSDPARPLQADALGLQRVTAAQLAQAFQVSASNPLVGLDGRAALLQRLGHALQDQPALFGTPGRPGELFAHLTQRGPSIAAHDVLTALLTGLAPIWPPRNVLGSVALGDCWPHAALAGTDPSDLSSGWVPFHKLSQWLTYSLLEPFQWAGIRVEGLDALTGLPEYRNGGLLIDSGVIHARRARDLAARWKPGDELVVEWRALTVTLLDELAVLVRQRLGKTADELPLACVLEGGTWAAGRQIAAEMRSDGSPPLNIDSDGTVF
ncbi:MAG: URC4/urg3 family protein [Polaromonas sp.]